MKAINYIVVHHSITPRDLSADQTEKSFNTTHKNRNWGTTAQPVYAKPSSMGSYIQYHFVIYGNGEIRQYRKLDEVGWHASNWDVNNSSIGICLAGDFDKELPSPQQIKTLTEILDSLVKKFKVPLNNIVPHRKFASKSCYGKNLSDTWARDLLNNSPQEQPVMLRPQKRLIFSKKTGTGYLVKIMPDPDFMRTEAFLEGLEMPKDIATLPDTDSL